MTDPRVVSGIVGAGCETEADPRGGCTPPRVLAHLSDRAPERGLGVSLPNGTQPAAHAAMTDTDLTARLAEALFRIDTDPRNSGDLASRSYDDVAADLLPVVREIAALLAAERV